MNASSATVGWSGVPTASILILCDATLSHAFLNSTRLGRNAAFQVFTVATSSPSR